MIRNIIVFLGILLSSVCFGLLFVVIFVNATEVDCALQSDESYTCETRTLLLGQYQTFTNHIEGVTDIKVERDSCSDGCSYRAEFVTTSGQQVPLSEVYTDQGPVVQQVNALRPQMVSGQESIQYREEPQWWILWLVGGLTLMSMLLSPLVFLSRR